MYCDKLKHVPQEGGADVSVVSVAINVRSTTRIGADGNFVLPQLRPGTCAWSFNILRGGAVPLDRHRR